MLQFFRNFFKSKIGLGITMAFLVLIAFAFASSDVSNTGVFGGVAGGNQVAVVGDKKLSVGSVSQAASSSLDRARQQDPTISMRAFVEQGGLESVLDQLIDRTAISEYARKYGLRAGDNLVNSEILQIPAFRGPDGNFSQDAYQSALRQQGLSDAIVREDLATGLVAQQLLVPASFGAKVPADMAQRYAELLKERRKGAVATIPSAAFAPKGDPTEAQLQAFYESEQARFIRPERRVLRYASFGMDALDASVEPTANEIAARYERDKAQYAASEERTITQLIVPTEQGAKALRDQIVGGAAFANVAQQAGFRPAEIGPITRKALEEQSSKAVSDAVFAADRGSMATLARSPLGWHVVKIDAVNRVAERTLADARPEIVETLTAEKRRAAIADLSARVEEEIDEGVALSEMAEQLGVELQTTGALTADGRVYATQDQTAPQELAPVLATAFQMTEGEPQLAEVRPGELFMIYEVAEITESAAAPLAEIKDQVTRQWRVNEGSNAAKAAADRVLARLAKGGTLAEAMAEEKVSLPRVDQVDFDRQQLSAIAQASRGVPPPLALMFSMAQGTSKKLAAPSNAGWFVVDLESISTEKLDSDDPLIGQTRRQLAQALGQEYADQLVVAMRKSVGVERNDDALKAVRNQLLGTN